jgi:hypothetical protein
MEQTPTETLMNLVSNLTWVNKKQGVVDSTGFSRGRRRMKRTELINTTTRMTKLKVNWKFFTFEVAFPSSLIPVPKKRSSLVALFNICTTNNPQLPTMQKLDSVSVLHK